jgi:hypothetical protein
LGTTTGTLQFGQRTVMPIWGRVAEMCRPQLGHANLRSISEYLVSVSATYSDTNYTHLKSPLPSSFSRKPHECLSGAAPEFYIGLCLIVGTPPETQSERRENSRFLEIAFVLVPKLLIAPLSRSAAYGIRTRKTPARHLFWHDSYDKDGGDFFTSHDETLLCFCVHRSRR